LHVVVIQSWQEESPDLSRNLVETLGVTPFEARQRLIGGGPAVVGCIANFHEASALAARLMEKGLDSFVLDAGGFRNEHRTFQVRRFFLCGPEGLHLENFAHGELTIPWNDVEALVLASRIYFHNETEKTSVRKFSLGRAALTGGLMSTKRVIKKEEVTNEVRDEILFLFARGMPTVVFAKGDLLFDGLGSSLQPTRSLNFTRLTGELRRLCPGAAFDSRLLKRAGQARLLGPTLNPEDHLSLAVEILARFLRKK